MTDSVMTVKAGGQKVWENPDGWVHREDGPAIERLDGTKKWYQNGALHREDGPAVEYADGTRLWYQNNLLHREDGPAVELAENEKRWYRNGNLHREGGPAIEGPDGTKEWYQYDFKHRADGPAVEKADGTKEYWLNGRKWPEGEETCRCRQERKRQFWIGACELALTRMARDAIQLQEPTASVSRTVFRRKLKGPTA